MNTASPTLIWVLSTEKSLRNKIQEIRNKKKIYEFVDAADPKKIEQLQKEIDKIK